MKKTFLTVVALSVLFISCKDNKNTSSETEITHKTEVVHEQVHEEEKPVLDNSWINDIQLDENGSKWNANIETTQGVNKMLGLITEVNPKTIEEYHLLASKLNEEKNIVIKKCDMVGPSHDNLHVFLHPLIDKIAVLGEVSSEEKGAEVTANIKENLEEYNNYFK